VRGGATFPANKPRWHVFRSASREKSLQTENIFHGPRPRALLRGLDRPASIPKPAVVINKLFQVFVVTLGFVNLG
jgi:hypothetical protein